MQRSCKTCRQRRRACDKARPSCGSCKKSGLLCEGYEEQDQKVFVNFDSKNVSGRKKKVLCDAIQRHHRQTTKTATSPLGRENTSRVAVLLANDDIRTRSLRVLDMTPQDFQDHVSVLWAYFEQNHTKTNCGWAPALTPLKLQNRSLDLALMSIASLRLSQHKNDPSMKVLSHTSYAHSLQIFRKLCEKPDAKDAQLLPVIALVYSLIEGTQEVPVAIFTPGLISFNSHLRGCIYFAQQSGPRPFASGGLHQAFKKIRELALLESLTTSDPSFLAEEQWMKGPWVLSEKTRRDRLHDIMASLTVLASQHARTPSPDLPSPPRSRQSTPSTNSTSSTSGSRARLAQLEIRERELSEWASEWHTSISSADNSPSVPLDIFYSSLEPEQIYLEVELWSVMLLLNLAFLQSANPVFGAETDPSQLRRRQESAVLARRIRQALSLPVFGGEKKENGCLIEGACRSLFPAWVTTEHEKMDPKPATPGSLHGSTGLGDGWTRPEEDFTNPQHLLGYWASLDSPSSMGSRG